MEGQRVMKTAGRGRLGPILVGVLVGLLLVGYLGLCAWVGSSGKILPNVTLAGLDVSGMTAEQAQLALDRAIQDYGDQATATLTYGDWSGTLSYADFQCSSAGMGQMAYEAGRESFLSRGIQYLQHMMGGATRIGLDNATIRMEQPILDELLTQAEETMGGGVVQMSYVVEGEQLTVTKGVTGVGLDRDRVLFMTAEAVESAMKEAIVTQKPANEQVDLKAQNVIKETAPDQPDFDALYQEIHTEAKSAEMLPVTYEITDHVVGVDFDPVALKAAYAQAQEGETIAVTLTITQPKDTRASLESKLFRDVLGQATSRVGGTENRKTNVKLSAEACNGVILLPGEVFSYNNTTGSRSADKGYLPAPIYVGGKSQDDTGGGICQTSSTIYCAVLHTTLEIVERHDHKFAVGYVTDGMDATVFYGSLDFQFRNSTAYPVKVETQSYDSNGRRYLQVKIYGTNEDGRYAVPESTIYDEVVPTTTYEPDETVAQGTLVLDKEQYAYTGKKARTYRYIYEKNGALVEKQDMGVSTYDMRPHLYYYNPLDGDPATWENGVPPTAAGGVETGGTVIDPSLNNAELYDPTLNEGTGDQTTGGEGQPTTGEQTGSEPTTGDVPVTDAPVQEDGVTGAESGGESAEAEDSTGEESAQTGEAQG